MLMSFVRQNHVGDLKAEHVRFFKAILGDANAITCEENPSLLRTHSTDWTRRWAPLPGEDAQLLLRPVSTAEVAEIVKYAHDQRLPLVPQGGNTGLVGGGTPRYRNEIVLSLSRMNRVISFDVEEGVLKCEAGCVLQFLNDIISVHGFEMPLDLGSKGSCQVGGNLSTNAAGVRFVRHGPLRAWLLQLQVVDGI